MTCVITQNVDNLHQRAGNTPSKVFELHGNLQRADCLKCGRNYSWEEIEKLFAGVAVPECTCDGIIKPAAVFFGEQLPEKTLEAAVTCSRNCDLFIVIGSTLLVYPAAYLPTYALDSCAKLAIINLMSTPMDNDASVVIRASAGETMRKVLELVKAATSGS